MSDRGSGCFADCLSNNIRLEPEWILRNENELADYYSHIVDYDDYIFFPVVFQRLDSIWGPHTVDSPVNVHLEIFNFRFFNPSTKAVDAFTCDWAKDNNWWFP